METVWKILLPVLSFYWLTWLFNLCLMSSIKLTLTPKNKKKVSKMGFVGVGEHVVNDTIASYHLFQKQKNKFSLVRFKGNKLVTQDLDRALRRHIL